MNRIRAIIIDDEIHCIETLEWQISKYCPEVELIDCCESASKGIESIKRLKPELIFLDIEMPVMNGFELLQKIEKIDFKTIFTTAYNQFALKAFKVSALDYLIKPIDNDDLIDAVQKAIENKKLHQDNSIRHLLEQVNKKELSNRVFFPTLNGLEFVDTKDITRCESESNYTTIYLLDSTKMVISKTLKNVEEILCENDFFRVHNSHIVNLAYVQKYIKGDGGYLVMKDGTNIAVSRSRKLELLDYLRGNS